MKPDTYDDYLEIDLVEVFYAILSHWALILITTVGLATAAYCYGRFMVTPVYSSSSALYVLSKSTSITSMADIQVGTNLTSDYMEVVKTRPVVEKVMKSLGVVDTYSRFVRKISVSNPSNTRFLRITVQDPDAAFAKSVVDELADVSAAFISEKMDQEPPTIIQYGYSDGRPVTRSARYYAALGGLAGAVASVAIIVLMYLLNDKIMTPEDLEKRTGLNVLASLPFDD